MIHRATFELLVGTWNPGKIREIQELLADLPVRLRSLNDFPDVSTVDEAGTTYEENSKLKALNYSKRTGLLALADDSGLEVDALGGRPGVYSARFGNDSDSDSERIDKLLLALDRQRPQPRTARFVCCLTMAGWERGENTHAADPRVMKVTRGECEGQIAKELRGNNGFGYDPVFVPNGYSATLAELPTSVKNSISHRAHALAAMRIFLEGYINQT